MYSSEYTSDFSGLQSRSWPRLLHLVTKAMPDRLLDLPRCVRTQQSPRLFTQPRALDSRSVGLVRRTSVGVTGLPGLARAPIRRRRSADGRMVNHDEARTPAALDDEIAAFPSGNQLSTLAPNIQRGCCRCIPFSHSRTPMLSRDSPHGFPNVCRSTCPRSV